MKIGKYRNSKWLTKAAVEELAHEQRVTTVDRVVEEEVGDDVKPVLYLTGIDKPWPVNMTGLEALAEITGSDDTDAFPGTPVEIYVDPNVRYAGQKVGGIKLRTPPKPEFDDDIGF